MEKNAHWYTDGTIDRKFYDGEEVPETFRRGRTNCGKGTKGYIGITDGTVETYIKPGEPIPEGFWIGWKNQSESHKQHISDKLKQYVKTPEHCANLSAGHKTQEYREKIRKSCIDKYGVDNVFKSPEIQDLIKLKLLEKYGVDNPTKNKEILRKARKKYTYKNEYFDSTWEIALYIYAIEHDEPIQHEPIQIEYTYKGKTHIYYPDFMYKGVLIEIKGDQFFDSDGNMFNPYNNDTSEIFEVKRQCAILNGVSFWRKRDVQFAIDYVNSKYGKKYLKSFKNA